MAKKKTKKTAKHSSDWLFWLIVVAVIAVVVGAIKYGSDNNSPITNVQPASVQQPASQAPNASDIKVIIDGQEVDSAGFKFEQTPANQQPAKE